MGHNKPKSIDKTLLKEGEYENPALYLARKLSKKDYVVADTHGERLKPLEKKDKFGIGILREGKLLLADYIGNIWVKNKNKRAYPHTRWVLEVYGKENMDELEEIVRKFAKPYKVDVKIVLGSKNSFKEEYL